MLKGLYIKPNFNDFIQEKVEPSATEVAEAYGRAFNWSIVPFGDTALNLLGLSTQVPNT